MPSDCAKTTPSGVFMSGRSFDRPFPTSHGTDGTTGMPPAASGKRTGRSRAALALALALGSLAFSVASMGTAKADITLNIDPVIESEPGRSWAAVGEMVMRYYSAPNTGPNEDYQCGLANFLTGQRMSEDCAAPAKITAWQATQKIIAEYLSYAHKFYDETPHNMAFQPGKVLPPDELIHELEFERPIVIAIEPPKMSDADKDTKEVALIVGYQGTADNLQIIVNDPRAYSVGGNPYIDVGGKEIDNGQYQVSYQDFLKEMRWTVSIYRIKPQ